MRGLSLTWGQMWFSHNVVSPGTIVQCGSMTLHDASHRAETQQCVIHDYTCSGVQHTFSRQRLKLSSKWAENSQSSWWWFWNFLGQGAYRSRSMATSYLGTWDLSVVAFDDCCKSGFSLSRNLKCCGYLSGGYQRILQVENISRIRLITKARRITAAINRSKDQRLGHDDSSKKRR